MSKTEELVDILVRKIKDLEKENKELKEQVKHQRHTCCVGSDESCR